MRRIILGLLFALGAGPAYGATFPLDLGAGVVCTLETRLVGCTDGDLPIPTPTPGAAPPTSTPPGVAACDAMTPGNLDRPLEANPTARGFDSVLTRGREIRRYCVTATKPAKYQGTVSAAWQDWQATNCSRFEIRLLSSPFGAAGQSSGWSVTPSLPYKLLAPSFVAPPGTYWFELESDSTACPDQRGRFRIVWTHY